MKLDMNQMAFALEVRKLAEQRRTHDTLVSVTTRRPVESIDAYVGKVMQDIVATHGLIKPYLPTY